MVLFPWAKASSGNNNTPIASRSAVMLRRTAGALLRRGL
jgi:hypothetical protein